MKIAIGNDHAGVEYKNQIVNYLRGEGHEVFNVGTDDDNSCDYPDYAKKVCALVASKTADYGILVCGTGVGMSIAANKVKGIRASLCHNSFVAEMTRRHNDSNVLCIGARVVSLEDAIQLTKTYLSTPFDEVDNPDKHTRRISKIEG